MNLLKYIIINIIGTLLRSFPLPCKTGLIKIGAPDQNSPVFLTGNYTLTVERVKKALTGTDCYLLIANSKGINVWCAAAGGHFTTHDVISALKISGIAKLVKHQNVVLPQLAATGIESERVKAKTGWNVIWGPVYAKDIREFVKNNFNKTAQMREVRFDIKQRIEMAVMWAFPFSIFVAFIALIFWTNMLLPLILLTWLLPLLIFISFPLYSHLLNSKKAVMGFNKYNRYTIIFQFSKIPVILEVAFILSLILYGFITNMITLTFISQWSFISFLIILLISIDLMGSTPVYKSGLHEDRVLTVVLNKNLCDGCGLCVQVCPKNCYELDQNKHITTIVRGEQCVQCGACIVQCPHDALFFKSPENKIISPDTVRKFKLNLIGKRLIPLEK